MILNRSFIALTALVVSATLSPAQQGDRKGQVQKDPMPASSIPPAPLLDQKAALKTFQLAKGFVIEPVVADSLVNMPVALSFDADGRVWLVEMTQYMVDLDGTKEHIANGKIKVLEDTDGDGVLDKETVFLDDLVMPRAVAVMSDGVLYANGGRLEFIKRDGLKPVGKAEVIDPKYAVGGNAEHQANGLLLGLDNWYYSAKSSNRYRRINGKWVMEKTGFRGQWGISQDDAGRLYYNTNSVLAIADQARPNLFRHHPRFTPKHKISHSASSRRVFPIRVNPGLNRAYQKGLLDESGKLKNATAAAGLTIYRGENFPSEFYGSAFAPEPGANLVKALRYKRGEDNVPRTSFHYDKSEFLASTDEWFRPVNMYTAPDGSLWMIDMYFGLLQHKAYMTSYLRKQYASRDLDKSMDNNGRIYRLRYAKNPLSKVTKLSALDVAGLVGKLSVKNGTVRDLAQRLLVEKCAESKALDQFKKLATTKIKDAQGRLHALWVFESTGSIPHAFWHQCLLSEHTDLNSSALELVSLVDDQAKASSDVVDFQPKPQSALSTVFALGQLGSESGYARAQALMKQFGAKVKMLPEVYVSGLAENISLAQAWPKSSNGQLTKLMGQASSATSKTHTAVKVPANQKSRIKKGQALYLGRATCAGCHGAEGQGQGDLFPALAPSDWVSGDVDTLLKVVLHGLEGPIKVNGKVFKTAQAMPKFIQRTDLSDEDIASLLTFIRYMKGNRGGVITAAQVKSLKAKTKGRTKSYTEKELRK